ncbi:MAG: hypothetical protein IIB83_08100 [Bacteroidetes bacterium]|nr:hypothetical protein [Bacteroidota bacterium]
MKKKRVIEINIWDDITMEYISSIRPGEEELGLIIKGHLLIENILNQIIEIKFKNSKLLFDDNRTNSFSVKLNILYSLGFIPKYIFQNITNINKIRNQYAHNLKVDSSKLTFIYYREDKKINNKGYFKKKRNPVKEYIKLLCFGTLSELRNLFIKEFGKKP